MQHGQKKRKVRPAQKVKKKQGKEKQMEPQPVFEKERDVLRLRNKTAIITGGDSGIGKAVAIAFAKEGADVVISYYEDDEDARSTAARIESIGQQCLLIPGDIGKPAHCKKIIEKTMRQFGKLNVLVNNAGIQFPQTELSAITPDQLKKTFETNIFAMFYMVQAAEEYLQEGASIINTTSVTAYRGSSHLLDYSATKGAIVSFTRSLSAYFAKLNIRVNGVAPGPVWTPLIPATFPPSHVSTFGSDTPLGRAGEPVEIASSYIFLASDESSYITGQVLHPNGGEIVNT
ncbi:glucose 1-dehydrogenase [Niastella sp. OAS944]|uniref:glucose 1-dehydrogenase n=1 Tax=Niastella sp. OAS944 TaxID=2664089 RepID=UPI003497DCBA|nr:NAD(P)-dependent dehydrogenase (short-subunit alcohol dehydrogenase family) [Chitinophagaceae bacterium OAS944]